MSTETIPQDPIWLARSTDPETSHEAAAQVNMRASQAEVLRVLRNCGPLTDWDIHLLSSNGLVTRDSKPRYWSPERLRTARKELERKGLVEWTGEEEKLPSGRYARVWRAVEKGIER